MVCLCICVFFFFQAEDGIRDLVRSRGLGDVYKRQVTTLAGNGTAGFVDGPGATAQFTGPSGVTVNSDGLSLIHI